MHQYETTIDHQEINKFAELAHDWWDFDGPLKTLHDINKARLEFIQKQIGLSAMNILDVGCGGGILAEAMAKLGAEVTGIDAECSAIEIAKQHAQDQGLKITYECTAIEDFTAKSFDTVTCMELLEHVQNPEVVLQHCKRLLKPEGLLFVSTISRTLKAYASAIIAAEYLLQLLPRQTHDYNKFIKPSELAAIARPLGLQLIDIQGMNYNPFTREATLGADVSVNYVMVFQSNPA